jgi:hypothetical protein
MNDRIGVRAMAIGVAVLGAVLISPALSRVQSGGAGGAPVPPIAPSGGPRGEWNTVFLPPGTYTAIVIATTAKDRRWVVTLRTAKGVFPITVAPGETTVVPFTGGWRVNAADQARLESKYVPFEDISERTPVDGNENVSLGAWGITDQGPVNFAPPRRK